MAGFSQPIYMSEPEPTVSMLASSSEDIRNHDSDYNPPHGNGQVVRFDESAIEPSLAGYQSHNEFQYSPHSQMTADQEASFQLRLQAAAAAASDDRLIAEQQQEFFEKEPHDIPIKHRRIGRACDACSRRKVKCGDETPCKNCLDLEIQCTFSRPHKRRGPINKVASELKRARPDSHEKEANANLSQPPDSPSHPIFENRFSVRALANDGTLHRLISQFFTYVYPIFPFPQESVTMKRLWNMDDKEDKAFCALIAALLATISAMFPRLAQNCWAVSGNIRINMDNIFIDRCLVTCQQCRSPFTSDRSVDDAATRFYLGLVAYLRGIPREMGLYMSEALGTIHYLDAVRDSTLVEGNMMEPNPKAVSKRIFWAIYNLSRLLQQTGEKQDLIPPCRVSQLPTLPSPTEDDYNYPNNDTMQLHGYLSSIEGFSVLASIYSSYHSILKFDVLDDEDREHHRAEEIAFLRSALHQLDAPRVSAHPDLAGLPNSAIVYVQSGDPNPQQQLHIHCEIQKIVIWSTILRTRWFLAKRLCDVQGGNAEPVPQMRKKCLSDLATLMANATRQSLEPVEALMVPQLRQVLGELKKLPGGIEAGNSELETCVLRETELFGDLELYYHDVRR